MFLLTAEVMNFFFLSLFLLFVCLDICRCLRSVELFGFCVGLYGVFGDANDVRLYWKFRLIFCMYVRLSAQVARD